MKGGVSKLIFLLILSSYLFACNGHHDRPFGGFSSESPEYKALSFFQANYNTNDFDTMLALSSVKYQQTIQAYQSPNSFSRYLLNLQYDQGVDINIDRSFSEITSKTGDRTSVTILFTGHNHGRKIKELKRVLFIKEQNKWLINDIEPVV
ncbi:hypothetical protein [Glaciecola sp. KUL10]|uniref:hypothetical protein n=1 Tax=Glaciecola sp. (strain KUL10) TaxID=2161813 RepID=UPI000D787EF3|nr:hypothetical protein [Glaciecola sp. KUL10]GBL06114.1 hypothetical protein KUL10_34480 [Glaciecola sp. KUL10]